MSLITWRPDDEPQHGALKYRGPIATGYDAKREESPKWLAEQTIIENMLADLPAESVILDCPVGTGRFLPYYASRKFWVWGVDLSEDMLKEAAKKGTGTERFMVGDVRQLDMPSRFVDAAVACRITRWLEPDDCQKMMRELQRVTRKRIIVTARVANHPHARPVELFTSTLDWWHLARNEAGYEPDYRVLCFEPIPGSPA